MAQVREDAYWHHCSNATGTTRFQRALGLGIQPTPEHVSRPCSMSQAADLSVQASLFLALIRFASGSHESFD
jgi:hypothetical protein